MFDFNDPTPSNIPTKPKARFQSFSFPDDLTSSESGRNYYTQINFVQYSPALQLGLNLIKPSGGCNLPLPRKINEIQTLSWESESATSTGAQIGQSLIQAGISSLQNTGKTSLASKIGTGLAVAGALASGVSLAAGVGLGVQINPALFMKFKTAGFKEHTLSWTFTPNNEKESQTLSDIINYFKYNSLPSTFGPMMFYPSIAMVKLYPNDAFTFKFKPCAVTGVQVDYSGGGGPSFFRKNGAPTVVNLTVGLKEIDLWTKNNYNK